MSRKPYPNDVSDEEWAFVAPYLTLMKEDAPQRDHDLREVFNGVHYVVRTGCPWRSLPHDLPPWEAVSTNNRSAGSHPRCSKRWCMTCERCYDWQKGRKNNLQPRFSMEE